MTEPLADLSAVLDDALLKVPTRWGIFTVPQPSALDGLRMHRLWRARCTPAKKRTKDQRDLLTSGDEETYWRLTLGGALDEMLAAGVSFDMVGRVAETAFLTVVVSPEVARAAWEQPLGEAQASTDPEETPSTTTPEAPSETTGSRSSTRSRRTSSRDSSGKSAA